MSSHRIKQQSQASLQNKPLETVQQSPHESQISLSSQHSRHRLQQVIVDLCTFKSVDNRFKTLFEIVSVYDNPMKAEAERARQIDIF